MAAEKEASMAIAMLVIVEDFMMYWCSCVECLIKVLCGMEERKDISKRATERSHL